MVKVKLTLGERIQDKMNELNLSFDDVLKETNISRTALREILTSSRENITSKNLIKLSGLLNVSVDYLLGLQEDSTTNLDLQAISNEYGISSKAMENIKRALRGLHPDKNYKDNGLLNTLNTLFENNRLDYFLSSLERYFSYYPYHNKKTFVFSDNLPKTATLEELEDMDMMFDLSLNGFYFDDDKAILDPLIFSKILLDDVTNELNYNKEHTENYIKCCEKDLESIKSELDLLKNVNFIDYSGHIPYRRKELELEIKKLQTKIDTIKNY